MPDRLTERVSAAIAAEAEQRAAGFNAVRAGHLSAGSVGTDVAAEDDGAGVPAQTGPVEVPGRPDLPHRSPHRSRRRARSRRSVWTSPLMLGGLATAGVLAVVVGAVVVLNQAQLGPATEHSASASGAGAPNAEPRPARGVRNPPLGLNGAGIFGPDDAAKGIRLKYHASGQTRLTTAYSSRANYTRGDIARGVRSVVINGLADIPTYAGGSASVPPPTATAGPTRPAPASSHPKGQPKTPLLRKVGSVSVGQIEGCLNAVAPSSGVIFVEVAYYQDKRAIIIVGKPVAKAYLVTVAGLACSATEPDVLARITVPEHR